MDQGLPTCVYKAFFAEPAIYSKVTPRIRFPYTVSCTYQPVETNERHSGRRNSIAVCDVSKQMLSVAPVKSNRKSVQCQLDPLLVLFFLSDALKRRT
ncbi:hypothetical protein Trydic_g18647 [Trypoxylus dichotomus]